MTKPVVFVSAPIHRAGLEMLEQSCVVREVHHPIASDAEIEEALADADAVIIRSMPLNAERLHMAPRLKVIAKHGAGMDSIDIPTATELGVVVANSGDANAFAVAEQAVALMLAVLRRIVEVHRIVLAGGFQQRETLELGDLTGATVGLVGFGNIGRHAAQMVGKGFNSRVLAYDPAVTAEEMQENGAEKADDLATLLKQSDIVSLHVPLISKTRHLIGNAELKAMKSSAIIVNTSRGGIIDETALVAALKAGTIRGAGLDVFEQEPPAADNPLLKLDSVVLSPHLGGLTEGARRRAATRSAQAALDVLSGREPEYFINKEVAGRTRAPIVPA